MPREWITEYKNGARSEVAVFKKPRKGLHESDRIRLRIKPEKGKALFIWMHALEAADIIAALSHAVATAIEQDLPLSSKD